MAQIQVRDENGVAVPRINIRISQGTLPSEAAIFDYETDLAGNKGWPIPYWPEADYTLYINRQNVDARFPTTEVFVPAAQNQFDVAITLPHIVQPIPIPEPIPAGNVLTVDRQLFRAGGTVWRWKGCSAFLLPQRHALGEDINPFLDWAQETGFNLLRCFVGMSIVPPKVGLPAYLLKPDQIARFLDVLQARGLRCELTVGDMQILMPNTSDQQLYFRDRANVTANYPGVVDETCNEPFKNGVDVGQIGHFSRSLQASGDYGFDAQAATYDFITVHPERKSEWPRTAKDGFDFYEKWRRPIVMDEGVGAGESLIAWSRSNVPADFYDYAATAALMCAGATFHFEDGVYARLPGPVQRQCAQQFVSGFNAMDVEAPYGEYTRGGLGSCPIEHSDDLALRTFGRIIGNRAEVVVVRPLKQQASDRVPVNGWRISRIEGERNNIVHLER